MYVTGFERNKCPSLAPTGGNIYKPQKTPEFCQLLPINKLGHFDENSGTFENKVDATPSSRQVSIILFFFKCHKN